MAKLLKMLSQLSISNTWISGPIPKCNDECFSRILSLHKWMKNKFLETSVRYINHFKVFKSANHLFRDNQRYLNKTGIKLLAANNFAHLNNGAQNTLDVSTSPPRDKPPASAPSFTMTPTFSPKVNISSQHTDNNRPSDGASSLQISDDSAKLGSPIEFCKKLQDQIIRGTQLTPKLPLRSTGHDDSVLPPLQISDV